MTLRDLTIATLATHSLSSEQDFARAMLILLWQHRDKLRPLFNKRHD